MVDLNLQTTNRYQLIMALGGKCRICLSDKIQEIEIDHIYNDGAEERAKYGTGDRIWSFYLSNLDIALKRLQPLCSNCHNTKTWAQKTDGDMMESLLGQAKDQVSKMSLFMDELEKLEGTRMNSVHQNDLINALVKTERFTTEESRNYIRRMLRECCIYESKPSHFNRI